MTLGEKAILTITGYVFCFPHFLQSTIVFWAVLGFEFSPLPSYMAMTSELACILAMAFADHLSIITGTTLMVIGMSIIFDCFLRETLHYIQSLLRIPFLELPIVPHLSEILLQPPHATSNNTFAIETLIRECGFENNTYIHTS